MEVVDIVKEYLIKNKYDGLYSCESGDLCCCTIDDLEPCGEMRGNCEAGHKVPCECGEGCDFHIG